MSTDDPLLPLITEATLRFLEGGKWPIIWVVGDTWVVHHRCGDWTIGPDELATKEQVRELIVRAGGVFELYGF